MQFFFASPVRFSQIMLGKNLAHAAIFALEVVLVWVGTACSTGRHPSGLPWPPGRDFVCAAD